MRRTPQPPTWATTMKRMPPEALALQDSHKNNNVTTSNKDKHNRKEKLQPSTFHNDSLATLNP
jgi:hypothetical protein